MVVYVRPEPVNLDFFFYFLEWYMHSPTAVAGPAALLRAHAVTPANASVIKSGPRLAYTSPAQVVATYSRGRPQGVGEWENMFAVCEGRGGRVAAGSRPPLPTSRLMRPGATGTRHIELSPDRTPGRRPGHAVRRWRWHGSESIGSRAPAWLSHDRNEDLSG